MALAVVPAMVAVELALAVVTVVEEVEDALLVLDIERGTPSCVSFLC